MLIFSHKINMAGHADFFFKNSHGQQCWFFLKKFTWPAMLIFSQKINMAIHADFFSKN